MTKSHPEVWMQWAAVSYQRDGGGKAAVPRCIVEGVVNFQSALSGTQLFLEYRGNKK